MKRYALLIEAGRAKDQQEIAGPAEDARRMRVWFGSNSGGAWEPGEIETLSNPSAAQVAAAVKRAGAAEYTFVAFSGHGWIEEDGRTGRRTQKIIVGTGESIDFQNLRPAAKKCTLLCDACREVIPVEHFTENRKAAKAYARERERYPRQAYRSSFDAAVTAAAEGTFMLYGCSANEYCYEDPLTGGYFTSALIETAADWTDGVTEDGCLLMPQALALATARARRMTLNYNPKQNPGGGPTNRAKGNEFPFAVALV
jgi:hypothetical protein